MRKNIFIASTEQRSGKSLITIGLIHALEGFIPQVGYMKPISQRYKTGSNVDEDAILIKEIFGLCDELSDISPVSMDEAREEKDDLFEKIFDSYNRLSSGRDIMVIEGTDYTSAVAALELDINAELAKNLGAPVLLVGRGSDKSIAEIVQNVTECTESIREMGCDFLGVVINGLDPQQDEEYESELSKIFKNRQIPLFGTIPRNPTLFGPRLKEVAAKLKAEVIYRGDELDKVVTDVKVLAMSPENALGYIKDKDGYLLITPGDRIEHIFTVMSAQKSSHFPRYSGLLLTGGLIPGENVQKLIAGITDADLTILSAPGDTYGTALKVNKITGELSADDPEKIELVYQVVERNVHIARIHNQLGAIKTQSTTPRMFQYRILEMAKSDKRSIVLPEGSEKRIIQASAELLERGICEIILIGNRDEILETSKSIGVEIGGAKIIEPEVDDSGIIDDYAETYYQLRKHKNVTKEMARDWISNPVHYAAMMVYKGQADGFVSGSTHSTAATLAPVLRIIRTKPGVSLASSIFFMCMPDKVLVYGDCALVENPNAEQMADIAITSAETAKFFGIDPIVAMLSYSTGESGKGKGVDKVREATRIARHKRPDLLIEGPIQYDAATSIEVASVKLRDSKVAGKATVYIFPSLDAGNTVYKAVQRSANIPAIGPVLQGLNKPANDLSRGATVTDIIYTVAVTAIQAQEC